jgi:hypothetical protein
VEIISKRQHKLVSVFSHTKLGKIRANKHAKGTENNYRTYMPWCGSGRE